jgi:thioredoxin 1
MGHFTSPVDQTSFDEKVIKSNVPVLVDFWADWCAPCRGLAPKLEEIAQEMSAKIKVMKVDVDQNQNLAVNFGVSSIPTLILFKNGKPVDQIMGNHPKENIVEFISRNI